MAIVKSFRGFRFAGCLFGGPNAKPIVQMYTAKDTEELTAGDFLNLESGEVDLAVRADRNLIGVCNQTLSVVSSTTSVPVITNVDAVWEVYDMEAREVGDRMHLSAATPATGAMAIDDDTSGNFVVAWPSPDRITYVTVMALSSAIGKLYSKDA